MTSVENVVLVTLDGVRTQEMFNGLDIHVLQHALYSLSKLISNKPNIQNFSFDVKNCNESLVEVRKAQIP
jgi:urate oxidase